MCEKHKNKTNNITFRGTILIGCINFNFCLIIPAQKAKLKSVQKQMLQGIGFGRLLFFFGGSGGGQELESRERRGLKLLNKNLSNYFFFFLTQRHIYIYLFVCLFVLYDNSLFAFTIATFYSKLITQDTRHFKAIALGIIFFLCFLCMVTAIRNKKQRELKVLCCCCSVAKLCLTLCDPMKCSRPGFPVLH